MNTIQIDSFEKFQVVTRSYNIEISKNQLDLFKKYYEVLLEWNKKINLISRKEKNILERHFLDSIIFLPEIEGLASQAPTVLDIGSGGGFPAIPIAIMKPSWHFVLCESIKKKAKFLTHIVKELNFEKNIKIVNQRVEALHATPLRSNEKFDLITVRAVAKLNELIKYALPLLKKNGYLLAYKAKDIDEEIKNTEKLIEKNKLKLEIFSKEINGIERRLIVLSHPCLL